MSDEEFELRPGRVRDGGAGAFGKPRTLVGRVRMLSRSAGKGRARRAPRGRGTGHRGRGRSAALARRGRWQRRVIVKARIVRHRGLQARAAPLARHLAYLGREGTSRDGSKGVMFDASSERVDGDAFAGRCANDRHHFRFIVSPEDARDMADLRAFTRELMTDMAHDLGTRLDWVAIDHWNTDNPHIHVLVRGVAQGGEDLVIDRAYITEGLRARAAERVTAELGPRSEREIAAAMAREVDAERWTGLDRRLAAMRDQRGQVDLRPDQRGARRDLSLLIGRAQVLERMGLARQTGSAIWQVQADLEPTLHALGERGDIIRTMNRALAGSGAVHTDALALHDRPGIALTGRLVERGLHDELTGEAYAIIEGLDGRAHHLRFADIEQTGDAQPGAIVATATWTDRAGRAHASLLVRSDLPLAEQIGATGATWLDRQLVTPHAEALVGGFGREVAEALEERFAVLEERGLARAQNGRRFFVRNLLARLRESDLAAASEALAARYGIKLYPSPGPGDVVAGTYRERVTLASGRFAMIDDGLGFQLVPWRQDLERHLGMEVSGRLNARGGVDWSFSRTRGPAL